MALPQLCIELHLGLDTTSVIGIKKSRIELFAGKRKDTVKLFTIGDSISQGFMSGGAAKPQFSFGTLLANAIHDREYSYLRWSPAHHLKVDLEFVLRALEKEYGSDIQGLEWACAIKSIARILDEAEDYFERGEGKIGNPVGAATHVDSYFQNVAVEGMDVGDAWMVTPQLCKSMVAHRANRRHRRDNLFAPASDSFYRNAYRVLNPYGTPKDDQYGLFSPLQWLDYHCRRDDGIQNTTVWLGGNNALATVVNLNIRQTSGDGRIVRMSRPKRREYNLWHPRDFDIEYSHMMNLVDRSMRANRNPDWRVFVGTIPLVTIAPFAKGLGDVHVVDEVIDGKSRQAAYYEYYSYFMFSLENALRSGKYLTFSDARFIDATIQQFNQTITSKVDELNRSHGAYRYHVVDISTVLSELAWKRNMGNPTYQLPHELRVLTPPVNTRYYHASREGRIQDGGVFSLDGIHPTAIGQGIIAWEFLKAMQKAGAVDSTAALNWDAIVATDTLRQNPICLMSEWHEHEQLINFVCDVIRLVR
ncbi:MAG: hypothetical protein JXX14_23860 [Deltaproteobacteria bacterium]|nr:hypothetical protein [Deltaproteobacteria bacterium]